MARILSITSPFDKTDALLHSLQGVQEVYELQLYRAASVNPPGDVIKLGVPNSHLNEVMRLLDAYDLGKKGGLSISSSAPVGLIPSQSAKGIERDNNQASWEEMALTISDDSNTSLSTLIIMFISGALAAVGIATNALHIVIGGMLVAPGFMPLTRMALGIVARHRTWRYGVSDFFRGYLALMVGAAATAALLKAFGYDFVTAPDTYYVTQQSLVQYWTSVTAPSVIASIVASVAGALLVASKKSVFTSGVMIGLALVPAAALFAMALLVGEFDLALKAALRFLVEIVLVLVLSLLTLLCIKRYMHRRDMRL